MNKKTEETKQPATTEKTNPPAEETVVAEAANTSTAVPSPVVTPTDPVSQEANATTASGQAGQGQQPVAAPPTPPKTAGPFPGLRNFFRNLFTSKNKNSNASQTTEATSKATKTKSSNTPPSPKKDDKSSSTPPPSTEAAASSDTSPPSTEAAATSNTSPPSTTDAATSNTPPPST